MSILILLNVLAGFAVFGCLSRTPPRAGWGLFTLLIAIALQSVALYFAS